MNKSHILLILSLIFITATLTKIDDDDFIDEVVVEKPKEVSPYKKKGSLSSQVHLLSQMSDKNPNVTVSLIMP